MHKRSFILMGSILAILLFTLFIFPFNRMVNIVYVSRDEIVDFERKRIKEASEENLFYGKIDDAISLVQKISANQGNNRTIVIYSMSPVFTKGVESISLNVHREVIDELQKHHKK